jgi:hypothetical protein
MTRLQTAHVTSGWTNAGGSGGVSSLSRMRCMGLEKRDVASKLHPGGRDFWTGYYNSDSLRPVHRSRPVMKRRESVTKSKRTEPLARTLHVYSNNRRINCARNAGLDYISHLFPGTRIPFGSDQRNLGRSKSGRWRLDTEPYSQRYACRLAGRKLEIETGAFAAGWPAGADCTSKTF